MAVRRLCDVRRRDLGRTYPVAGAQCLPIEDWCRHADCTARRHREPRRRRRGNLLNFSWAVSIRTRSGQPRSPPSSRAIVCTIRCAGGSCSQWRRSRRLLQSGHPSITGRGRSSRWRGRRRWRRAARGGYPLNRPWRRRLARHRLHFPLICAPAPLASRPLSGRRSPAIRKMAASASLSCSTLASRSRSLLDGQFGMDRRETCGDDAGRRLDQPAARFAGHVLQRVEQMPQLAELQRAEPRTPAAERNRLRSSPPTR